MNKLPVNRFQPFRQRCRLALILLSVLIGFAGPYGNPAFAQDKVFTFEVDYDDLGRVQGITHPGTGVIQAYSLVTSGKHDTVAYNGETIISGTTYNAANAATEVNIANHGAMGTGRLSRSYDMLNRLKSHEIRLNNTIQYRANSLTYNSWGYLESLQRNDPASSRRFSYQYGNRGELTRLTIAGNGSVDYGYDVKGNLTSRDALNTSEFVLPSLPSVSYDFRNQRSNWDYDADGKLLADDAFDYVYNPTEQVETVIDGASGQKLAHYLYDGTGERVREVVDDRVIYSVRLDGRLISQEIHQTRLDGGMDVTRKDYVYHNGQAMLTVTHHPDGTTSRQYQYRDRMGHPAVIADEEDGYSPRHYDYSPFGIEMRQEQADIVTHEFTGHERDEVTGQDYMHARYYDSNYGRFNRPDPAFDFSPINPFSYNLYGYTRNNPVNAWDPDGLSTVGEMIEDRIIHHARQGNDAAGFGFTVLKTAWDFFGMESVSVVADKGIHGEQVTLGEAGSAILDVATMGKGKAAKAAVSSTVKTTQQAGSAFSSLRRTHKHGHGFSARNINEVGGTTNCASCAIALDATLAGKPTKAIDSMPVGIDTIERRFGGKFIPGLTVDNIAFRVGSNGPGSRGIVFGYRGPNQIGHVFNVVRQKDTVRFIDGQTGTAANLNDGFVNFWYLQTK